MKTKTGIIAILLTAGLINSQAQDTWTQKADFGGTARNKAAGFSIGSTGYIGTGDDGVLKKDFWKYDPTTNAWIQKANFRGTGRANAAGFSIGSTGYIGDGYNGSYINEFWAYDSPTDVWTQKASVGTPRQYEVGFSIGGKGYIGTGYDGLPNYKRDFWEYDPVTSVWTQKANFGGTARALAVGFSIGSKGYIGTGNDISAARNDFWEYDPDTNTWTQKADFGGTARNWAVGFPIGNKGYIGTGYDLSGVTKDFWEYDPVTDTWTQRADFGGTARGRAVGFSIGSKGYIGTGADSAEGLLKDFWEYTPDGGNSGACLPPPPGLVSWWSGDKTADDLQGTNAGVLLNGASFTKGMVGPGFLFNGTNQWVKVRNSESLNPTRVTVDAWIYMTGNENMPRHIIGKDDGAIIREYSLGVTSANNVEGFVVVPSGLKIVTGVTTAELNTWYHIAMTYDGVKLRLYVNGIQDGVVDAVGDIIPTVDAVAIGGDPYGEFTKGIIDEAQIFNRALTDAEILAIYQAGADGQCKPNIFVASIDPSFQVRGRQYLISTAVAIQDVNGVGIEDATTTIKTTFPDRSVLTFPAITDRTGQATISFYSTAPGRYQFKVQRVSHPTRVYDASLNVETSDTLVIP